MFIDVRFHSELYTVKSISVLILSVFLLGHFLGFTGCRPDPELPPITTEGRNSFGCKIKGEIFVPERDGIFDQDAPLTAIVDRANDSTLLQIIAANSPDNRTITLELLDSPDFAIDRGEYTLLDERYNISYFQWYNCVTCTSCGCTNIETGFIRLLRYDAINKIISGTFEFTATSSNSNCPKIRITEGRFDLPFFEEGN